MFTAPGGVRARNVRDPMAALFAEVGPGRVPHVVVIDDPYQGFGRISPDGSVAYATVTFDKQSGDLPAKAAQPIIDAVRNVKVPVSRSS